LGGKIEVGKGLNRQGRRVRPKGRRKEKRHEGAG